MTIKLAMTIMTACPVAHPEISTAREIFDFFVEDACDHLIAARVMVEDPTGKADGRTRAASMTLRAHRVRGGEGIRAIRHWPSLSYLKMKSSWLASTLVAPLALIFWVPAECRLDYSQPLTVIEF